MFNLNPPKLSISNFFFKVKRNTLDIKKNKDLLNGRGPLQEKGSHMKKSKDAENLSRWILKCFIDFNNN